VHLWLIYQKLFEQGKLKELSRIETEDIVQWLIKEKRIN
jgi:hypothetical protein